MQNVLVTPEPHALGAARRRASRPSDLIRDTYLLAALGAGRVINEGR